MNRILYLVLFFVLGQSPLANAQAQGNCVGGCNDNAFLLSSDANTIEYDNMISTFHSSMVRETDGTVKVWGQGTTADGDNNLLVPTILDRTFHASITKPILKFAGASKTNDQQFVILTEDGLYAWGTEGNLIENSLTSGKAFQKVTINGNSKGMPTGVEPCDVKMMFGSYKTLAIVTKSGAAYMLSNISAKNGNGTNSNSGKEWTRVETAKNTSLNDVVAVRGTSRAMMALTKTGKIYTWGTGTYINNGGAIDRNYATEITLPSNIQVGSKPKMIGMTQTQSAVTYYVLMDGTEGRLYSMGDNSQKQLGVFNTTASSTWVRVRKGRSNTDYMDPIAWISPQEHDSPGRSGGAAINVLTKGGKIYAWGTNNGLMIGGAEDGKNYDPIYMPGSLNTNDVLIAVETGGHTTVTVKQCSKKFGYVGHSIRGSMGGGNPAETYENKYNFGDTYELTVCGAPTTVHVQNVEICPNKTANLDLDATVGGGIDGYTIEWYTTNNRATGSFVEDPTKVGLGTYYAFYIPKNTGNCEDPSPSEPVVVSLATTGCCKVPPGQVILKGDKLTN